MRHRAVCGACVLVLCLVTSASLGCAVRKPALATYVSPRFGYSFKHPSKFSLFPVNNQLDGLSWVGFEDKTAPTVDGYSDSFIAGVGASSFRAAPTDLAVAMRARLPSFAAFMRSVYDQSHQPHERSSRGDGVGATMLRV